MNTEIVEETTTILPEWLSNKIPNIRDCGMLGYDKDKQSFWVENNRNGEVEYYDSISNAVKKDCNLSIHSSIKEMYKVKSNCVLVNDDFPQVIFVNNDADKLDRLHSEWKKWQETARIVKSGSASWQDAYTFIESFPLFWYPLENNKDKPTFTWSTRNGHDHINHALEDNKIVLTVVLDNATVLNEEESHVEISDDSIEQAYVKLAEKLMTMVNIEDCSCR